jgi:Arc/MetJ-type ribon-helix-helix transcriptional regulator
MAEKSTRELKKAKEPRKGRGPFASLSLPRPLVEEIEKIVTQLGYWPNKTSFIREAVMEKMEKHRKELETRKRVGS